MVLPRSRTTPGTSMDVIVVLWGKVDVRRAHARHGTETRTRRHALDIGEPFHRQHWRSCPRCQARSHFHNFRASCEELLLRRVHPGSSNDHTPRLAVSGTRRRRAHSTHPLSSAWLYVLGDKLGCFVIRTLCDGRAHSRCYCSVGATRGRCLRRQEVVQQRTVGSQAQRALAAQGIAPNVR